MHTMHLLPSVAIQPNLELKTQPKQLLGSLLLVIALPAEGNGVASLGQYKGRFRMELHALTIVNNCLNTNISSYLETSGGHNSNLYLNVVHFFNTGVN
jgi:hypothetical protein